MRGLGRPDFAILKPVQRVHGYHPWSEGYSGLKYTARNGFVRYRHARNISTTDGRRILVLSGRWCVCGRSESMLGIYEY